MHEELGHALMEAIWEMDNLPVDTDAAMTRLYGILDDLSAAIERTYAAGRQPRPLTLSGRGGGAHRAPRLPGIVPL
jgi:hypothetical protein